MRAKKLFKQFRMYMPNMPMTLVSARNATARSPARATFRGLPKMTKQEIKEYLTQIYGLPVGNFNTNNFLGKRKHIRSPHPLFLDYIICERSLICIILKLNVKIASFDVFLLTSVKNSNF